MTYICTSIVIDWIGPFHSMSEARKFARDGNEGPCLYMLVGRSQARARTRCQYVGVAKRLEQRLHERRFTDVLSKSFWLGLIPSQGIPGRSGYVHHSRVLNIAENAVAYFMELPLNQRKRAKPPAGDIVIANRWWHDHETPRLRRPHAEWPDLIEYDYVTTGGVKLITLTGARIRRLDARGVKALRRSNSKA